MGKLIEKLSDTQIRRWIKAGKPLAKADGNGLTFTFSSAGTAAWVLRFRFGGKARELTLGRYPDKSLAQARSDAKKARASIQDGVDVAREKQLANVERAAAKSFRQLATDYMGKAFPGLAASTVNQRRHHIENVILPKLGQIPAREVTTADVVLLVEGVGKKSINVAELVFTALSEIFKHGIARHVVKANPCAGISVSAICGKPEPKRQRLMLTEAELRAILPALPSIGEQNALTVKILLATCVRIGELARAEWAHIDFERGLWFIPDAHSKTGKGFTVPLVPAVAGWFKELEIFACGSPLVLPARQLRRRHNHGGDIHFEPRTLNAMLHKLCDRREVAGNPVRRFTPHDLRSTARSWLTSETIGASVVVAERCLNHTLGGLLAVYDVSDYLPERRAVLEKWTGFLLACEAGKDWNVIPLRAEKATAAAIRKTGARR
jgi:integrase